MTASKAGRVTPVAAAGRVSPLGASSAEPMVVASATGVEAWELPFTTQLNLRLAPEPGPISAALTAVGVSVPTTPNRVESARDVRAIWLAPDEWLIVGPAVVAGSSPPASGAAPGAKADGKAAAGGRSAKGAGGGRAITEVAVGAAVRRTGGSVVDVSTHRTILRLSGPRAAEILAQGCSIDLHPRSFAVGACAQTLLARVDVILERRAAEEFAVYVRGSFAPYLVEWLRQAMGLRESAGGPTPKVASKGSAASPKRAGRSGHGAELTSL